MKLLIAFFSVASIASACNAISAFQVVCGKVSNALLDGRSPRRINHYFTSRPCVVPLKPISVAASSNANAAPEVEPLDFIQALISSADVVVFSTTLCPHCLHTKRLLQNMKINFRVVELNLISNGLGPAENSVAVKLYEMTGQRTVPNIFIKGKHLGGNDEVQAAAISGELERMLMGA
mmetsp:Transcript_16079/g.33967  ORF Transcript_16079/g.33967 Transcript_16079/m.33967 type:complete len:178 (+) Transcript_16079:142-675(+)